MLYILHTHWLWLYGALALGLMVGCLTYRGSTARRSDRLIRVAIGAVGIGALLAITAAVPVHFSYLIELGVMLTAFYVGGCIVGRALRDLADFIPAAATLDLRASAAISGSYLFRDAFAGMGAGPAYLRMPATSGGVARERFRLDTGVATRAPAPGGYTFPKTLPFINPTTSPRAGSVTGLRPHWSWPSAAEPTVPPPSP